MPVNHFEVYINGNVNDGIDRLNWNSHIIIYFFLSISRFIKTSIKINLRTTSIKKYYLVNVFNTLCWYSTKQSVFMTKTIKSLKIWRSCFMEIILFKTYVLNYFQWNLGNKGIHNCKMMKRCTNVNVIIVVKFIFLFYSFQSLSCNQHVTFNWTYSKLHAMFETINIISS